MTSNSPLPPASSFNNALTILRRYGYTSIADIADKRFNDAVRVRQVVIVGEVKRGKSALVNALIGRRGLLPVGVNLCTSAPIRILTSAGSVDESVIHLHAGENSKTVPRNELHDWASFSGTHVANAVDDLPNAVTVDVGNCTLADVTIIDTPGVGGLDENAVRLALRECKNAGVLIMVCDASTPITRPEMDILKRVDEEGGEVIVAVTKIDKNLRRWRAIVEDDKRLIAQYLGKTVPVVGVSSLRAVDAVDMEVSDPKRAAVVKKNSGIDNLKAEINAALALGDAIPKIAGLEAARDGLGAVQERIEKDLKVAAADTQTLSELEQKREELRELKEHGQEWEQYLQRNLALRRTEILNELDSRMDGIQQRWSEEIRSSGIKALTQKPQAFTAHIEGELHEVMSETLTATMRALEQETLRLFDDDAAVWSEIAEFGLNAIAPPEVVSKAVGKKTENLFDPGLLTMGVVGAGLFASITVVAPVAGAAWIAVNIGWRAMRNGRTALLTWLRETISTTRVSTARMMDAAMAAVRPELIIKYRSKIRNESEEIAQLIEETRRNAKASADQRQRKIAKLEKNKQIVDQVADKLGQDIKSMRSAVPLASAATGEVGSNE
ncbi:dynamin family protein [Corynebacterium sp. H78]|uniref:dynamin family protein n=1 Tax=Corynebacterium sp. H78 TaxID=3133417 RepID=UPI0030A9257C